MNPQELIGKLAVARTLSHFGPDFSDGKTASAWYGKLRNLDGRELDQALNALSGDERFPTVNKILDFVAKSRSADTPAPDAAFELLWSKIGSVGGYSTPELPNEIGLTVQRLGGWKLLCNTWTSDKREWHYKAFKEVYGPIVERKEQGLMLETSKYSPEALKSGERKALQPAVKDALRMAMGKPQQVSQLITELKGKRDEDRKETRGSN